jgi:proteasome lid subunit RPN8/RPN11
VPHTPGPHPKGYHPILTRDALTAMYAHAARLYPKECCGFVLGPRGSQFADHPVPAQNIADRLHAEDPARNPRDARAAYQLSALDLFSLQKSFRGERPAKILYHSRPESGSHFSGADQAAALFGGEPSYPLEYVVIDVREDRAHGARQFAWSEDERRYEQVGSYD